MAALHQLVNIFNKLPMTTQFKPGDTVMDSLWADEYGEIVCVLKIVEILDDDYADYLVKYLCESGNATGCLSGDLEPLDINRVDCTHCLEAYKKSWEGIEHAIKEQLHA